MEETIEITIRWNWRDVQHYHPEFSKLECLAWLQRNKEALKDSCIEAGNNFLEATL